MLRLQRALRNVMQQSPLPVHPTLRPITIITTNTTTMSTTTYTWCHVHFYVCMLRLCGGAVLKTLNTTP
jgi:hypothetical protein